MSGLAKEAEVDVIDSEKKLPLAETLGDDVAPIVQDWSETEEKKLKFKYATPFLYLSKPFLTC
jgi:hypothetical protein